MQQCTGPSESVPNEQPGESMIISGQSDFVIPPESEATCKYEKPFVIKSIIRWIDHVCIIMLIASGLDTEFNLSPASILCQSIKQVNCLYGNQLAGAASADRAVITLSAHSSL